MAHNPPQLEDYFKSTLRSVLHHYFSPSDLQSILKMIPSSREQIYNALPFDSCPDSKQDPLAGNLDNSITLIALYKILTRYGFEADNTGRLLYRCCKEFFELPPVMSHYREKGKRKFHQEYLEKLKQRAGASKLGGCYGFVFDFVLPGDSDTWEYGIDYTRCGILEAARTAGALEVMPYLCLADYPIYRAFGIGLRRSGNLGANNPCCDFRFYQDGKVMLETPEPPLE